MSSILSAPVTSAVVRFLLDRLDDDYAVLDRESRSQRGTPTPFPEVPLVGVDRLRGEIIAKRHVIGDLQQLLILRDQPFELPVRELASRALCAMASPYAAHRAFRTEWQVRTLAPS